MELTSCKRRVKIVRGLAGSGAVHSSRFVSRGRIRGRLCGCDSGAFRTFPLDFLLANRLLFCAPARGRACSVSTGRRFESCLGSSGPPPTVTTSGPGSTGILGSGTDWVRLGRSRSIAEAASLRWSGRTWVYSRARRISVSPMYSIASVRLPVDLATSPVTVRREWPGDRCPAPRPRARVGRRAGSRSSARRPRCRTYNPPTILPRRAPLVGDPEHATHWLHAD